MQQVTRLGSYPRLQQWYQQNQSYPPQSHDTVGVLVWGVCRALSLPDPEALSHWNTALRQFFKDSPDPISMFQEAEDVFAKAKADFMGIATEFAETAVRYNHGDEHYNLLDDVAEKCDIPVFRFLAAWTALNIGALEKCIDHCEAVEKPFACIYTLMGQAQLELGLVEEAIETLEIATTLSPDEVLALFQLAKAYQVSERNQKAWQTLERLQKVVPNNLEVAAFFAMIALSEDENRDHLSAAWRFLSQQLDAEQATPYLIGLLLDLAFVSREQSRLEFILDNSPWSRLRHDKEFLANVPWILKRFEECGWHHYAKPFLEHIAA